MGVQRLGFGVLGLGFADFFGRWMGVLVGSDCSSGSNTVWGLELVEFRGWGLGLAD